MHIKMVFHQIIMFALSGKNYFGNLSLKPESKFIEPNFGKRR